MGLNKTPWVEQNIKQVSFLFCSLGLIVTGKRDRKRGREWRGMHVLVNKCLHNFLECLKC